jgi:hypothetical protein
MTDREFTPPTEFPAEYRTTDGQKAVLLGEIDGRYFGAYGKPAVASMWFDNGASGCAHLNLHDLPKKTVSWMSLYDDGPGVRSYGSRGEAVATVSKRNRTAVLRIEQTEGEKPQVFVEDV